MSYFKRTIIYTIAYAYLLYGSSIANHYPTKRPFYFIMLWDHLYYLSVWKSVYLLSQGVELLVNVLFAKENLND